MAKKIAPFFDKEYIICAAIWFQDGNQYVHQPVNIDTGIVICGRRHHNCLQVASALNCGKRILDRCNEFNGREIQGFLTSKNRFVGREEAAKIAMEAGQIKKHTNFLFSEDIY
jgi:hypothetical protein